MKEVLIEPNEPSFEKFKLEQIVYWVVELGSSMSWKSQKWAKLEPFKLSKLSPMGSVWPNKIKSTQTFNNFDFELKLGLFIF